MQPQIIPSRFYLPCKIKETAPEAIDIKDAITINTLTYFPHIILGSGSDNTVVFRGRHS